MHKCMFCKIGANPSYKDTDNLEKFLSPRKKIVSREKSGLCAKHQRMLTKEMKYARYIALVPYVSYQGLR